jgi:3-deoxy-D-manno-octulosonic-acid transferase
VNARLSERSFRGYEKFGWLTKAMFRKLHLVAAQDPTYAERFVRCGVPRERVRVTGATKFDNVLFDRHCEAVERLRTLVGLDASHHVWIVGSTQSPEEAVATRAFIELRKGYPNLRLIVVPRHPERFDEVYRVLEQSGVHPLRRSAIRENVSANDWQVLLVDTVGELRWWWGLADTAIVGGSFGARGGQNMLEPAAFGANVAFGPNTSNFRDISEMLLVGGGAARIEGLEHILPWMREQLSGPELGMQRGHIAQTLVRKHQGALSKTVDELQTIINGTQTPSAVNGLRTPQSASIAGSQTPHPQTAPFDSTADR